MGRIAIKVVYWLAVLVVSVALLIALVMFFEARDDSQIEDSRTEPLSARLG